MLFFFLLIDLYFSIPAVIPQFLTDTAELVIHAGLVTDEANTEIDQ